MTRRQPVPTIWLLTDERMGDALWPALARLPRGGGIVFRHHATPPRERAAIWRRLTGIARRRGLVLVDAGPQGWRGTAGTRARRTPGLVAWPAHDRAEAVAGWRAGATVLFVSPVFATRTHPGARVLGPVRAATVARGLPVVRIALGGMTERRFRALRPFGFDGWAAIDAWLPATGQKRNAVPT